MLGLASLGLILRAQALPNGSMAGTVFAPGCPKTGTWGLQGGHQREGGGFSPLCPFPLPGREVPPAPTAGQGRKHSSLFPELMGFGTP